MADERGYAEVVEALPEMATLAVPARSHPTPTAVAKEEQVSAVESALAEAREQQTRKPTKWSVAVSLAGPFVLIAKSVEDAARCFISAEKVTDVNWLEVSIAVVACAIGTGASISLLGQLSQTREVSKIQVLAQQFVDKWLSEMGKPPKKAD